MEAYDISEDRSDLDASVAGFEKRIAELLTRDGAIHELAPEEGSNFVFWVLRDPDHPEGFRMVPQLDRGGLSEDALGFGAAPQRPDAYPDELPFLEDTAVVINPDGAELRVHWIDTDDGLAALRSVVDQCEASGWVCGDDAPIELATRTTRYVEMRKGDRIRVATLRIYGNGGSQLDLLEDQV